MNQKDTWEESSSTAWQEPANQTSGNQPLSIASTVSAPETPSASSPDVPDLWDTVDSLEACRNSELRATIAEGYRAEGEPRIEVYRVLKTLREEQS